MLLNVVGYSCLTCLPALVQIGSKMTADAHTHTHTHTHATTKPSSKQQQEQQQQHYPTGRSETNETDDHVEQKKPGGGGRCIGWRARRIRPGRILDANLSLPCMTRKKEEETILAIPNLVDTVHRDDPLYHNQPHRVSIIIIINY